MAFMASLRSGLVNVSVGFSSKKHSKVLTVKLHSENSNYREDFAEETWKFVQIIEVFELQRFE